jgi:hypothetical protein
MRRAEGARAEVQGSALTVGNPASVRSPTTRDFTMMVRVPASNATSPPTAWNASRAADTVVLLQAVNAADVRESLS